MRKSVDDSLGRCFTVIGDVIATRCVATVALTSVGSAIMNIICTYVDEYASKYTYF